MDLLVLLIALTLMGTAAAEAAHCPPPELILPCICASRVAELQIWCTHSELPQVVKGLQNLGGYVKKPIDELIIENNFLPSLPGKVFQPLKILRLMLRHNGIERMSTGWLGFQEDSIMEIYIVENELKSLPVDSLDNMINLQAITLHSTNLRKLPIFSHLRKLRYLNIQSNSLSRIEENSFVNVPNLEKIYIKGCMLLDGLEANVFKNIPKLSYLEISNCSISFIHMRAMSMLPDLMEISLEKNNITDASLVGRSTRDIPNLSVIRLDSNMINVINEASFVDLPSLVEISITKNKITEIHHGAFHRVPKLRKINLNHNYITRIHPESFLQPSGSGVEELSLIHNHVNHVAEFRAILDALPRLKFLDMSENYLQDIPRGALRGHPTLERLHLDNNRIKIIEVESFMAMPALRELRIKNNSLSNMLEGPFWNLPALKGLDLSHNFFHRIEPKMLYNIPSLRKLDLSQNDIVMIDPISFLQTPFLEFINLSSNALVTIHPATFRNLMNLYELDLSNNRLIEFAPGLPRGIEYLHIEGNQISNFPVPSSPDLDLPSLKMLDISSNGIQKIPQNGMKLLPQLKQLRVNKNGLRQIEEKSFQGLNKLELIDIGNNQLLTIHPGSFKRMTVLKHLDIHGNILEDINLSTFNENKMLKFLDMSKNRLKSISHGTTGSIVELEVLNISSNFLIDLPESLYGLSHLKILDVSANHIKNIMPRVLTNLAALSELRMVRNKVSEIREGTFKDDDKLQIIDLESNQVEALFSGAIRALANLHTVFLARNRLVDIPDAAFAELPQLRIVELQENRLQTISNHAFYRVPLIQYLNLSHNQLMSLDLMGLRSLQSLEVLDVSYNKISRIDSGTLQNMEWLVELRMDSNRICAISGTPFKRMPRLKVLSLRNNRLKTLSENSVQNLRSNIAIFDIDGNPLSCNCGLLWFKSWLLEAASPGPRCNDGSLIKEIKLSRSDCDEYIQSVYEHGCELEDIKKSPVFDTKVNSPWISKINEHSTVLNNEKVHTPPSPEESEYFYDEYIDYPYNETGLVEVISQSGDKNNNNFAAVKSNSSHYITGDTPTIYAATNSSKLNTNIVPTTNSGFTFFGMQIPNINMGSLWNIGRKTDRQPSLVTNYRNGNFPQKYDQPKFETGGFTPLLPSTAGGFKPIINPSMNSSQFTETMNIKQSNKENISLNHTLWPNQINETVMLKNNSILGEKTIDKELNMTKMHLPGDGKNSTMNILNRSNKMKGEMSIEGHYQWGSEKEINKYNKLPKDDFILPESIGHNMTVVGEAINEENELQGILITTDIPNDMLLHQLKELNYDNYTKPTLKTSNNNWTPPTLTDDTLQTSSPRTYSPLLVPESRNIKDNIQNTQSLTKRPATIVKVFSPHSEHLNNDSKIQTYMPVNNRGAKTSLLDRKVAPMKDLPKYNDSISWYFKNYNQTNNEPFIGPGVVKSNSSLIQTSRFFHIIFLFILLDCTIAK